VLFALCVTFSAMVTSLFKKNYFHVFCSARQSSSKLGSALAFRKNSTRLAGIRSHAIRLSGMAWDKCKMNQITALIKVSFLKATNGESIGSVVEVHVGKAAAEVEAIGEGAINRSNRTAPVVGDDPHTDERTINEATAAG